MSSKTPFSEFSHCKLETLPPEAIERDPDQPRHDFGVKGDEDRLLSSIKRFGLIVPVHVAEQQRDRYFLIDGHRRHICAVKLGLSQIPVYIWPKLAPGLFHTIRFEAQNNRRPWKPGERSESFSAIKEGMGFTSSRQLSEHLHLPESTVAVALQLRNQRIEYLTLMERYQLSESYRAEFLRLKRKLCRIDSWEIDDITVKLFERINRHVINNSKELRALGKIFDRAITNKEAIVQYLTNDDMTIAELQQRTLMSGFAMNIEKLMNNIVEKQSQGIAFSPQEKDALDHLKGLLEHVV